MSYFSTLTDIVTCNLSEILANEADPEAAIEQIVYEIQEGVSGALRSMDTARNRVRSLEEELSEHRQQAENLAQQARDAVAQDNENDARKYLLRKTEQLDLVAGLEQQLASANNLVSHLTTTHRALEARLHDAQRKQREFKTGTASEDAPVAVPAEEDKLPVEPSRSQQIEDELAALKKQLGRE
jgi:phage shock protein A